LNNGKQESFQQQDGSKKMFQADRVEELFVVDDTGTTKVFHFFANGIVVM
jgi:hypothetical protein